MIATNVINSGCATVSLRPDGILQLDVAPGAELALSDAIECVNALASLAAGVKRPILINTGSIKSADRQARAYFGSELAEEIALAVAILVSSPVGRVIGSFVMAINRPSYPRRIFTAESEALDWLRTFLR